MNPGKNENPKENAKKGMGVKATNSRATVLMG